MTALAMRKDLMELVVLPNQSFGENYNGSFKFSFWELGERHEVQIDDLLPVLGDKLKFAHSSTTNEFWSPLVEKAYAKFNGSYEVTKVFSIPMFTC